MGLDVLLRVGRVVGMVVSILGGWRVARWIGLAVAVGWLALSLGGNAYADTGAGPYATSPGHDYYASWLGTVAWGLSVAFLGALTLLACYLVRRYDDGGLRDPGVSVRGGAGERTVVEHGGGAVGACACGADSRDRVVGSRS